MDERKKCVNCGVDKPFSEFYFNKGRGFYASYCKPCQRTYNKQHRKKVHEMLIDYLRTHPCVDCGEKDPIVLELDHENPENKSVEIAHIVNAGLSKERLEQELAKSQVRCANCHRRRTAKQFGWYKTFYPVQTIAPLPTEE